MSERPKEPNKASGEEGLLPIDKHIEKRHGAKGRKVRHYGIYLLSSLFTTAALFSSFYAVINGMSGQFANAAIAILVVMVLDGLDSRVARLTSTQSALGAEYDSLSDMVAFDVAPALVTFEWAPDSLGRVGWIVAFIYVADTALHLARLNTQVDKANKCYFIGLASPAAAALMAGMVWAFNDFGIQSVKIAFLVALLVATAGVLIVSNIRYHSFKDLDLRGRVPFVTIPIVMLAFAVAFTNPPHILLLLFLAYAASGSVQYLLQLRRRKQPSWCSFQRAP